MDPLISTLSFVAFDFETTGFSPDTDEIVELGAVKFTLDQIEDQFQQIVKPQTALSVRAVEVHGITETMVAKAPPLSQVLPDFLQFIGSHVLVAHNAVFDIGFLQAALQKLSLPTSLDNIVLDTLAISRRVFPRLSRYGLQSLVQNFHFPRRSAHRALDDAFSCRDIFLKAVEEMGFFGNLQLSELQQL